MQQQHTFTVPAEYAEHFRRAVLSEVKWDAGAVENSPDEGTDAILGWMSRLNQTVALINQVPATPADADVQVTSDAETLASVFEEMARPIVGPKAVDALAVGPQDHQAASVTLALLDAARWGVARASEMHAAYGRERGFEEVA